MFYIQISTKKQAFDFSKINSYTNICLIFLCDAKLTTSLLVILISSKNLKAVYLSFHRFNDSGTREFELVTGEFELVTRGFKLAIRKFELVTREFELLTCGFELVTRGFELALLNINSSFVCYQLVVLSFQLETRNSQRVTCNSCFTISRFLWYLVM